MKNSIYLWNFGFFLYDFLILIIANFFSLHEYARFHAKAPLRTGFELPFKQRSPSFGCKRGQRLLLHLEDRLKIQTLVP